ncbi:ER-derived vesicles protein erv46 [Coemansia sp. RSA 1807]|nr:ER-derived vesicles protein erv46 [Coemansia sp. RSA 1591]KAJ2442476.1 ER-derived vesicles protein erv46 [Coemansia sp. RSA 2440]KAJ2576238.1 ER-derived vesicles protein erv46 [Coemansia sp. RSA 1807]
MGRAHTLRQRFQSLDAYAKTLDDFSIKTLTGGVLTVATALLIAVLVGLEFAAYRRVEQSAELVVDRSRSEKMLINLDITLPHAPCVLLGLDVLDSSGDTQINLFQHVTKMRLTSNGTEIGAYSTKAKAAVPPPATNADGAAYCGSCYGGIEPEGGCCNTCDAVHQAYVRRGWAFTDPDAIEQCVREGYTARMRSMDGEGCHMHGFVEVGKAAGNLHILAGESIKLGGEHTHTVYDYMPRNYDMTHTIHRLAFGSEFSAQSSPLDGVGKTAQSKHAQFQYFTKIVGSEVRFLNGTVLRSNQYSATEFVRGDARAAVSRRTPGLFVMFDISPMRVIYTEHQRSLGSFLTSVCAIVGGIFTVARLVDGVVFRAERVLKEKRQLGKQI